MIRIWIYLFSINSNIAQKAIKFRFFSVLGYHFWAKQGSNMIWGKLHSLPSKNIFIKSKIASFEKKWKTKKKETNNTSKIFRMENQKFNSIRKYNWPRFGIEFSDTLYELVWMDICQTQIQLGYNWQSFTKYLDLARSNSQPWKTQLMKTKVQSIQLLYHRALYQ